MPTDDGKEISVNAYLVKVADAIEKLVDTYIGDIRSATGLTVTTINIDLVDPVARGAGLPNVFNVAIGTTSCSGEERAP